MNRIIEDYQCLSDITGKMRAAAAAGEWDELIALEHRCAQQVAELKPRDGVPADETSRLQKIALIRKMLADDKAIRDQTETWMHQLDNILRSARSTRRLQQAYQPQG